MKKLILTIFVVTIFSYSYSQSVEHKKTDAVANTKEGICLFVFCKPLREYEYLGSIKQKVAWTGQPNEMIAIMIKKVKKQYPEADGIIFTDEYMGEIDVVKFK